MFKLTLKISVLWLFLGKMQLIAYLLLSYQVCSVCASACVCVCASVCVCVCVCVCVGMCLHFLYEPHTSGLR